eukprot:SAG31_NODE_4634_length_3080_cov_2.575595_2_plen_124_part_00
MLQVLRNLFDSLDVHNQQSLNDLQVLALLRCIRTSSSQGTRSAATALSSEVVNDAACDETRRTMTNLSEAHCYRLVDMLDLDKSGNLEFDEFYVLMCMLIAIKVWLAFLQISCMISDAMMSGS